MSIGIRTLTNSSIEQITEAFNLAFSDYFVPVCLTTEQLQSKMKADRVNLDYSVGAFENGNLIGFILHGTNIIDNKNVVYNGGTGVIPDKRGQALTKQMYDFILPILKDKGINYQVLEVISNNIQAIKSYERVGYKTFRKLKCYDGKITLKNEPKIIDIRELSDYNWTLMQSFWDFTPTWQNSPHALDELRSINRSIGAYKDNQLVGYVIYNPNSRRIQQIAVHKDFRGAGIASALFSEIAKGIDNEFSIVNIDENSKAINLFLQEIGFKNYIDQLEMRLELR